MMPSQLSTTAPKRDRNRVRSALALQQRDLFGVFARPHQIEAKIGLIALLLEIEIDQRPADQTGSVRAENA
jgi:hypothetical protein